MLPTITILGRTFSIFAILGLIGLFLAVFVAGFRVKRYNLTRSDPIYMSAFAGLGLLVGSVLLFAITQAPHILQNREIYVSAIELIVRLFGGMVFYGGLLGAFAGLYVYSRVMKISFEVVMKLAVPVLPLAHAIMRIGCFTAGCCYGIEYPPPLGIAFTQSIVAPNGVYLLPVQLFEAFANILIFIMLWLYTKKERNWVTVTCMYGISYSIIRFFLEYLRGDELRGSIFGISTSQFISILMLITCICCLIYYNKARMKNHLTF